MKTRRWFHLVGGLVVSFPLLAGVCAGKLHAAQFSADLIQSMDLMITTGRVYVDDARYRMDLQTPIGPDVVVIVDQTAKMTKVLIPMYKAYIEMPSSDQMSLMNDPFQAAEFMIANYSLEEMGSETIAGYKCTKQLILSKSEYSESQIMNRWVCDKLGFPLKIKMLMQEDTYTELSGIKEEPIGESMFQVPADFEKSTWEAVAMRGEADPDLTAKTEAWQKTRRVKVKLSSLMGPGHEMQVLIREGVEVRVKSEEAFDKPFNLFVIPYKGGKALKESTACTYSAPVSFTLAGEMRPDLIVAGTGEGGEASLEMTFVGQQPVVLATREEYFSTGAKGWTLNDPYERLSIRFTGDLEEGSTVPAALGEFSVSTGPWDKSKTDSFELELADGQVKSFEYTKADNVTELSFMIQTGRVRVQYIVDKRAETTEPRWIIR
ncbi:MAG: DUF4412 domain-containing protein [Candidatus Eisenbacteria bacterium]|uniref:DUF4412 domain-containing protein n=1 Tax=Eiseniibacteriota bacterium TaxID=2212470 RepID=A0A948W5W0_UNCEI|nr:DUF4412 domain-containing protein [Candidatus Eisenbacteria bacterium]MBU1949861.1 DUF4412 domain-containing protein [Candidatus Eisenbacteria bacterium]MBU2690864.1 DUF4412 domain-containing protein [Candidatus Eisenbacteria bacterium]